MSKKRIKERQQSREPLPEKVGEALVFSLERTVIPVTIGDGDDAKEYELKEATGDAAVTWHNAMFSKTKLGPDGKPSSMGAMGDTEPLLVSLCLFPKDSDRNVSVVVIRSWPNRIQKSLFEKAKEISDLEEKDESTIEAIEAKIEELTEKLEKLKAEEEGSAKNSQDDTTDG